MNKKAKKLMEEFDSLYEQGHITFENEEFFDNDTLFREYSAEDGSTYYETYKRVDVEKKEL